MTAVPAVAAKVRVMAMLNKEARQIFLSGIAGIKINNLLPG
jgi:hypothetical protein